MPPFAHFPSILNIGMDIAVSMPFFINFPLPANLLWDIIKLRKRGDCHVLL